MDALTPPKSHERLVIGDHDFNLAFNPGFIIVYHREPDPGVWHPVAFGQPDEAAARASAARHAASYELSGNCAGTVAVGRPAHPTVHAVDLGLDLPGCRDGLPPAGARTRCGRRLDRWWRLATGMPWRDATTCGSCRRGAR